MIYGAH
jgi:hypothetical protein